MTLTDQVFDQGHQDYFDGRELNPYDQDSEHEFHLAWEAGYLWGQFDEAFRVMDEETSGQEILNEEA